MDFAYQGFDAARGAALADAYARDGYVVVRGVFGADDVARIGAAVDRVHAEALAHGRSFRHGNLFYKLAPASGGGAAGNPPAVRMVQWPSYHQPVLAAARTDSRIATVLAPLIGGDLKQIINQLHWKSPGPGADFAWHQDSRFRKPYDAYRNLGVSYVQTGIAIDPHIAASGAMRLVRGSHLRGSLDLDLGEEVLGREMADTALTRAGLSTGDIVDLDMAPGDMALWSPYLVHGSGVNTSTHQRRFYINGYVRADDCDRGEWAFRSGEPVALGQEQALVHYEQLRENPGPHYP